MRSFRVRCIGIAGVLVAVSSVPILYLFAVREDMEARRRELEMARTIAMAVALGAPDALDGPEVNRPALAAVAALVRRRWPAVRAVGFYARDGRCVWHHRPGEVGKRWEGGGPLAAEPSGLFPWGWGGGVLTVSEHVWNGGERAGTVTVDYSLGMLEASLKETYWNVARILVCVLILAVFLSHFLGERVSSPVRDLIREVEKVSAGDLSGRVKVRVRDEIGVLAEKFNQMTHDLSVARNEIEQQQRSLEDRIAAVRVTLEQTQKDLLKSEKLAGIGQLAAGVAHELNNPLAGILISTQLLAAEATDEKVRESLREMEEQTVRCKRIIEGLLNFARGGSPEFSVVDANALLECALAGMETRPAFQGVDLRRDLAGRALRVLGDPAFLQRAFECLLMNAAEAVEGTGRVEVSSGEAGDRVEISVRDHGRGIPPEDRERIFDPFFTTKRTGEGPGLGLSVAYGIVERHGGGIRVVSEEGSGATFVVSLPRCSNEEVESP